MLTYRLETYFTKIENNKPTGGYFTLENLKSIFPNFDINNPPKPFVRYYKLEEIPLRDHLTYYGEPYDEYNGKVVYETRIVRPYTEEEKEFNKLETALNIFDNYAIVEKQWVYNEELGMYFPPCDPPTDGNYVWDSDTGYWVKIEDYVAPE